MTTKLERYALDRIDSNRVDCATIIQKIGNRIKAHEHEQLCQLMRDFEFLMGQVVSTRECVTHMSGPAYTGPSSVIES